MQSDDLKEIIDEIYNLEDHIIDLLKFTYKQNVGNNSETKICVINNYEELNSEKHSHLSNIVLKVGYKERGIIERDCSRYIICNDTS